jgi:hypothetical protein
VPEVTIFMHTNFIRGDKKRCLLMRSIVKNSLSSSSAQASVPLRGGCNMLGSSSSGAFMNQNLLEGLSRNLMGMSGQQMPQMNPLLFQGGGAMNVPNLFALSQQQNMQQQVGNNFLGILNGGNMNLFPFPGGNLSSMPPVNNASSNTAAATAQQQLNIADFLNNGNAMNINSMNALNNNSGNGLNIPGNLPFNMTINVPSNAAVPDAATDTNINAPGSNSAESNPARVSANVSSNHSTPPTNLSQTDASANTATAANSTTNGGGMNPALSGDGTSPVVVLAMQIMQNNSSIEPRTALELARKTRGET